MPAVFLSAGIPDQPERGPYLETSDPVAIRDAVRALAATVLLQGNAIVFGGHPAISPLVLQVARSVERLESVVIYQSREFQDRLPPEAREFPNFVWTPRRDDREHSLLETREQMMSSHEFFAGVFIGGMDGVEREYEMFRLAHPHALALPVFTTGGAARLLWERSSNDLRGSVRSLLHETHQYQSLFREVLQ